jgi:peptide/nickel transport system substrate-binding protein
VHLRRGAKWTDGHPITADDLISTVKIQRALAARDVAQAIFDWDKLAGIDRVDDYSVRFTLTEVYAPFMANSLATFVAPASVYGAIDIAKMGTDPVTLEPTVTGGPFKFEKRQSGKEIDLVANQDYYGGRPHIDRIVEKVMTDPNAAVNALAAGEVQWQPDLPGPAVDKLKGTKDISVHSYPDFGYYDVRFNDRGDHLFGDKLVRQAFAYAVDKNAIVRDVTGGTGTVLWGDVLPTSWTYDDKALVKYPVDRDKARQLMQQAGWQIGADGVATKGGKRFAANFYVRNDAPPREQAVRKIAEQVRQIGMDLQPQPVDFLSFVDSLRSGNFELGLSGWSTPGDPDQYRVLHSSQLKPEHNPTGRNWTGYADPQLDRLLEAERSTLKADDAQTRDARKQIFSQVEHLLGDNVVTYFMWTDNTNQGFSADLAGVHSGSGGSLIQLDYDRDVRAYSEWYLKKRN